MQRAQDDEEVIRLEQGDLRRKQHEEAIQRQKEHAEAIQRQKEREEQRNTAIKEASRRTAEAALKGVFAHFRAERAAEKQRNREVALCLHDALRRVVLTGLNDSSRREGADLVDIFVAEPTALRRRQRAARHPTPHLRQSGSASTRAKRSGERPPTAARARGGARYRSPRCVARDKARRAK